MKTIKMLSNSAINAFFGEGDQQLFLFGESEMSEKIFTKLKSIDIDNKTAIDYRNVCYLLSEFDCALSEELHAQFQENAIFAFNQVEINNKNKV